MAQRISVLVNSAAGGNRGLARTKTLVAELADRGWTVDLLKAAEPAQVASAITEAHGEGMDRLILAGGDGLIHHALPALVDSSIIVGIVPIGTGNDFSRGVCLPSKRRAALDHATGSNVVPVDVLKVEIDGVVRYGATVLTTGFSGRVNARANRMARRGPLKGSSRYTVATMIELGALEPISFHLKFDDEEPVQTDAILIAVGNTRYFGGGMAVCPDARFDDGKVDVVTIDPVPATTFARVLPLVFSGRFVRHPSVTQRRCQRLSVTTVEPLWVDGEVVDLDSQGRPVEISVMPGALMIATEINE